MHNFERIEHNDFQNPLDKSESLNASLLHRKSLQRFVRDVWGDFNKPIEINTKATNRKQIFLECPNYSDILENGENNNELGVKRFHDNPN